VQRVALQNQRCSHRQLRCCQLQCEGVLLTDLGVTPALGAVKLGHDGLRQGARVPGLKASQLDSHSIDTIFVAIERHQAAIRPKTQPFHSA
jgi:hypothetical protein